jgi:tRNA-specific 2-thiouridylase
MMLPVGGYQKKKIRELATELGFGVADKRDSQEICFVTSGNHGEFVRARRAEVDLSGEIVTSDGRVVGEHVGIEQFTIGQRKGLGVGLGEPYYVVRIETESRQVVIGQREELQRLQLIANRTNWLVTAPQGPFQCQAQIRYNSEARPATAEILPNGDLQVDFDQPVEGVAAGQAVVCYQDQRVLGGGWIC